VRFTDIISIKSVHGRRFAQTVEVGADVIWSAATLGWSVDAVGFHAHVAQVTSGMTRGDQGLRSLSRDRTVVRRRNSPTPTARASCAFAGAGNGLAESRLKMLLHEERGFSLATIHKVLVRAQAARLSRLRRPSSAKRYSRPTPGDRVQLDTMKIAPGVYQYTAVDDLLSLSVLGVTQGGMRTAPWRFIERVLEEMPFRFSRIQTDRGRNSLRNGYRDS